MSNFLKIYLNATPLRLDFSTNLICAAALLYISLPRFCYHDKLNIAGNCRICLVEIERSPKPQAACALPVNNALTAFTNTPIVKKARESVLEGLLVNHPIDCPICDQGGCCDLQDQAIKFGNKLSRFYIKKRGVEDKYFGPLIKTIISRCIHCTRCVRFASFVAGVEDLGTSLRGMSTEIGTYVYKSFNSEVSASVIDLCPVGGKNHEKGYVVTPEQKSEMFQLFSDLTVDSKESTVKSAVQNAYRLCVGSHSGLQSFSKHLNYHRRQSMRLGIFKAIDVALKKIPLQPMLIAAVSKQLKKLKAFVVLENSFQRQKEKNPNKQTKTKTKK